MVQAMTNMIAEGRSPFASTRTRQLKGRTVYELSGMGQQHFYFQSGKFAATLGVENYGRGLVGGRLNFLPEKFSGGVGLRCVLQDAL
jgi:hypothetical protein